MFSKFQISRHSSSAQEVLPQTIPPSIAGSLTLTRWQALEHGMLKVNTEGFGAGRTFLSILIFLKNILKKIINIIIESHKYNNKL